MTDRELITPLLGGIPAIPWLGLVMLAACAAVVVCGLWIGGVL